MPRLGTAVIIALLATQVMAVAPASASAPTVQPATSTGASLLDRGLSLAGVGAGASAIDQLAPAFTRVGGNEFAYSAYVLPEADKTLILTHLISAGTGDDHPAVLVLRGVVAGATSGTAYVLASAADNAPVLETAEFSVAAAGTGEQICGVGGAGAWYLVIKIIGIGSGLVGSIVGGALTGYICSMGNSPEPFGDKMTLNNYTGPNLNEVYTVGGPGPDVVVTGGYKLQATGCFPKPGDGTLRCWRVNSSGWYLDSVLFEVQIFWPDGSYVRFTQGTTDSYCYGSYYATFAKRNPPHGNYVTGFALAEYGAAPASLGGPTPTGSARHTVTVPT